MKPRLVRSVHQHLIAAIVDALKNDPTAIRADIYAAATPDLRREAADAMDRALSGGTS